jgi:hypothetical protein
MADPNLALNRQQTKEELDKVLASLRDVIEQLKRVHSNGHYQSKEHYLLVSTILHLSDGADKINELQAMMNSPSI